MEVEDSRLARQRVCLAYTSLLTGLMLALALSFSRLGHCVVTRQDPLCRSQRGYSVALV